MKVPWQKNNFDRESQMEQRPMWECGQEYLFCHVTSIPGKGNYLPFSPVNQILVRAKGSKLGDTRGD
jgi:hypothetical protein